MTYNKKRFLQRNGRLHFLLVSSNSLETKSHCWSKCNQPEPLEGARSKAASLLKSSLQKEVLERRA